MAKVRQRSAATAGPKNASFKDASDNVTQNVSGIRPRLLSQHVFLGICILNCSILWYVGHLDTQYPQPLTTDTAARGEFIEERARRHLVDITNFGSRPVGSPENEQKTVSYLMRELKNIKQIATSKQDLQIDVQRTSGTFNLAFLKHFTSYYDNVNNVLAKLSPKGGAEHSVMINCHYDSVINGTGASDDAVSCCIMLEVLRVLASERKPLAHNIVFVFNGAEENILQASHGFITQHKWAKDIKAFVNLEAAGAGGRELLFQAGPEHPWLIHAYAQSVPHPFATVVGQEIFESGLIPSDTDFRIYRDFGGLPGLDIAYISNGYVYHTMYDTVDMIPPGCIQRGGENLLAIAKELASSPMLVDPGEYKHGKLVFFDFLGMYMVVYPLRIGTLINCVAIAVVLLGIGKKLVGGDHGVPPQVYRYNLVAAIGVLVVSWLVTLLSIVLLAFLLDRVGCRMCWFTKPLLLTGLYAAPACTLMLSAHNRAKPLFKVVFSSWEVEAVYFDANLSVFAVLLAYLTALQISSAVLVLVFVLLPVIIRERTQQLMNLNLKDSPVVYGILHLGSTVIPVSLFLYSMHSALTMFIPIMGRAGPHAMPDLFIGALIAFTVIITMTYNMGLVHVVDTTRDVQKFLAALFLTTLLAVLFTQMGFPYGADPKAPTKQRNFIHHVERTFRDASGEVTKHDSGLLHIPFDRNSIDILRPHMPLLKDARLADCNGPYCGWPYYLPLIGLLTDMYYIPAPAPNVSVKPVLSIINQVRDGASGETITFSVTGPSHTNVYISPKPGVHLESWSLGNGDPVPVLMPADEEREHYFIFYSYGTKPAEPWTFWVKIQVEEGVHGETGLLDVALGGHYLTVDGHDPLTPELKHYLATFPNWTVPIGWAAIYEMWTVPGSVRVH